MHKDFPTESKSVLEYNTNYFVLLGIDIKRIPNRSRALPTPKRTWPPHFQTTSGIGNTQSGYSSACLRLCLVSSKSIRFVAVPCFYTLVFSLCLVLPKRLDRTRVTKCRIWMTYLGCDNRNGINLLIIRINPLIITINQLIHSLIRWMNRIILLITNIFHVWLREGRFPEGCGG